VLYRNTPSKMPYEGVIWLLAANVWYSAVLYGGWPHNYKFGGPRGWGSAEGGTHQRGEPVAHGAWSPHRTAAVGGGRRAPWERGAVAQAGVLPPPNHALVAPR